MRLPRDLSLAALVIASGAASGAASGCLSLGPEEDVGPAPAPAPIETPRFTPLMCTAGVPGAPACPVNVLDLSGLDATGSFTFVAQAVGGGLYLNQLRFTAGPQGLHIERPTILLWAAGQAQPTERVFDTIIDLAPGAPMTIDGAVAVAAPSPLTAVSLRLGAVGPYRP